MSIIRDFTDEKRKELENIIREEMFVNEPVYGNDWKQDLFIKGRIEDYQYDIEAYHKGILDKKNTTLEQLEQIFISVNKIDEEYARKFMTHAENLKNIAKCFDRLSEMLNPNPVDGGEMILSRPTEYVSSYLSDTMTVIYNQVVNTLVLVNSKGEIIDYDWAALHTIMGKDATQLPPEMYAALTDIFDGMSMQDKERFIEESYLLTANDGVARMGTRVTYWQTWELSPVYVNLSGLYTLRLYSSDLSGVGNPSDPIHEKIFNSMLLTQVIDNAGTIRSTAEQIADRPYTIPKPDVSIEEFYCYGLDENGRLSEDVIAFERKNWDYTVTVSGHNWSNYTFSVLQYREELSAPILALTLNELSGLSPNLGNDVSELIMSTVSSYGMSYANDYMKYFTNFDPTGILQLVLDVEQTKEEEEAFSNKMLSVKDKFDLVNTANALFWSSSMSIKTDGSIDTTFSVVKKYDLNIALRAYAAVTGDTTPSAEEIEMMLRAGKMDNSVDDYVEWYNLGSKNDVIKNYQEELRDACKEKYGTEKKPEALTFEEMIILEHEYSELFGG